MDDKQVPDPNRPWTDRIIEHLANPFASEPVSTLCKSIKISRQTYYEYLTKNRDAVFKEADKRRKRYMAQMRSQAFKSLVERFKRSDKALQMFFEMSGDYVPKSEQRVEYITPEQKRDKIKQVLEDIYKNSTNKKKEDDK